jgi:hypothetical protein
VAGYGYPVEESAPGSSTTEQVAPMTTSIGETARDAGTRVRDAAYDAASRLSDAAAGARARMTSTADDAANRAGGLAETVRQNPVLLGVLALAAGAAVSRSVRATGTGERLLRAGTDALGRRAQDITARAGSAARHTVEAVGGMASTAGSTVSDTLETVRSRVGDLASDLTDAAGRAFDAVGNVTSTGSSGASSPTSPASSQRTRHRQDQGMPRRVAGLGEQARGELLDMAQRYPLLLGSVGLAIGMAAGAAVRPTAAEDRFVGRASDALKRRTQQRLAGQFDKVLAATDEVIASMDKHLGEQTGAHQEEPNVTTGAERPQPPGLDAGVGSSPDVDTTAVVAERAEDAVEAQAAMGKKKPGPRSRKKHG